MSGHTICGADSDRFQSAYESGEMFIMENMKTGKKWPSPMKIAKDGKQQVVTPLPIAEQTIVQGNPIQELANWQYQLVMQQRMYRLSDMVKKNVPCGRAGLRMARWMTDWSAGSWQKGSAFGNDHAGGRCAEPSDRLQQAKSSVAHSQIERPLNAVP